MKMAAWVAARQPEGKAGNAPPAAWIIPHRPAKVNPQLPKPDITVAYVNTIAVNIARLATGMDE